MARLFDNAQSEYLKIEQAVLSGIPLAAACWFNTDTATLQTLFSIADQSEANMYRALFIDLSGGNIVVRVQSYNGIDVGYVDSASAGALNTWHHACGLWVAANDRRIFLNGGSKGTNATSVAISGLDRTTIGVLGKATPQFYMSGMIAEAAIWDLSDWPGATDSDKADNFERILPSLAKGFTPLHFPLGLKAYWPLIRGLNDKVEGYNLTASGTTVSAHPRIILPQGVL